MGLLIGALVIGGLIAAFTSLQSCIYNTKEARTSRVKEATYEANKPKNNWAPARPYEGQGYQVTY
jgi:gas vesicle protein